MTLPCLSNIAAEFNTALKKSPEDAAHLLVETTREVQAFLGGKKPQKRPHSAFETVVNNVIFNNPQANIFGTSKQYDYAGIKAGLRIQKDRKDDPCVQAYVSAAKDLGIKI